MVRLFERGLAIIAADDDLKFEKEGGRRRQFLTLCAKLQALLGRKPFEATVFHISTELGDGLRPPRPDEVSAARQRRALLDALAAAGPRGVDS